MHEVVAVFRQFRKSPGFALTVILTIALGIGANTAIFTLVHAVLLRSLPVNDPKMLYVGRNASGQAGINNGLSSRGDFSMFSYDLYKHMRETTPGFAQLAAMQSGPEGMNVREGRQLARAETTQYVSGNFFSTLGVGAFVGRVLTEQDDAPAAAPAAVMSYSAWQADYGSDPGVVGRTFTFQGHPITVVGIAPSGFYGDRISSTPPAFWIPTSDEPLLEGNASVLRTPTANWLYLLGRVKPGVSIHSLEAEMTVNLRNWLATQPSNLKNHGAAVIAKQYVSLVPGGSGIRQMQQQTAGGLYLLMAISGLVLLVACANVANLLLARGSAHRSDTALRMALGAARGRIIWGVLTESVLLSILGGAAGLVLAYGGTRMILSLAFPNAPQLPIHASPSLPVLGFAFLVSLGTGVLFGVVPAWMTSNADPAEALRGASRSTRDRVSLPQRSLIVFQAALSLILIAGAGMLTRSLMNLEHQNFGIRTANRYLVSIDPAGAGYSVAALPGLYQALQDRFGAMPDVANVGLALYSPLEGTSWSTGINTPEHPQSSAGSNNAAVFDRVSPQFFAAVGNPIVQGRGFTVEDTPTSQNVAVVNEAFAKKYFPGKNPIGQYFGAEPSRSDTHRIVGVVADAKYVDPTTQPSAMYFLPLLQRVANREPSGAAQEERGLFVNAIVLQFKTPPQSVDAMVRRTLGEINPNLTANNLRTFEYQVNGNFDENRLISRLAMLFGLLALVLAAVGLYGITSYQVARRTSEIGLRMALGATRGNVLRMVMRGAFGKVALGLGIGVPILILGARTLGTVSTSSNSGASGSGGGNGAQLFGVAAYDPVSLGIAVVALLLAAAVAGLIPARRAAKVEPIEALRTE